VVAALDTLARVFRDYPESPESGHAYETFTELLESHLVERLEAGAYAEVVSLYEAYKSPLGWVATRDTGSLAVRAAEAYEALGAPLSAQRVYESMIRAGTRALQTEELTNRVARTRVQARDPDALRQWVEGNPDDWAARLTLARILAGQGETLAAHRHLLAVASLAPTPAERLAVLSEASRLATRFATTENLLAALEARGQLRGSLPPGPQRDNWKSHDRLVAARLRFAKGEYGEASRLFRGLPDLDPADTYLLALAEGRTGRPSQASGAFAELTGGQDALFASLADLHLKLSQLRQSNGSSR
jgi:hypothetical protein